jgi:hypothetical protein
LPKNSAAVSAVDETLISGEYLTSEYKRITPLLIKTIKELRIEGKR